MLPLLVMLTVCLSNISLHPASNKFTIEMRELCESHGSKYNSIPLGGNWVNDSENAVC